jgi:hypothetical protein
VGHKFCRRDRFLVRASAASEECHYPNFEPLGATTYGHEECPGLRKAD